MSARDVDRLTEGQRECLRRVMHHLTSKDIARELGISPHTVDQRLRIAARTLGVASRFEAARILAQAEGLAAPTYQEAVYQAPDIASSHARAPYLGTATGEPATVETGVYAEARERQLAYRAYPDRTVPLIELPFPLRPGEPNRLGAVQRIVWVVLIAVMASVGFGALASSLGWIGTLINSATSTSASLGTPGGR